jgi:hypothetical protein
MSIALAGAIRGNSLEAWAVEAWATLLRCKEIFDLITQLTAFYSVLAQKEAFVAWQTP